MNLGIFFIGLVYSIVETAYFGWHAFPQSEGELIGDGIGLLIVSLSMVKTK